MCVWAVQGPVCLLHLLEACQGQALGLCSGQHGAKRRLRTPTQPLSNPGAKPQAWGITPQKQATPSAAAPAVPAPVSWLEPSALSAHSQVSARRFYRPHSGCPWEDMCLLAEAAIKTWYGNHTDRGDLLAGGEEGGCNRRGAACQPSSKRAGGKGRNWQEEEGPKAADAAIHYSTAPLLSTGASIA